MLFFSGFSLKNEEYLFEELLNKSSYSVSGFSYGAIKALHYVREQLVLGKRIDRLQLFSPAFFQTRDSKFKRLQMLAYSKNKREYIRQFIDSCFSPHKKKIVEFNNSTKDELFELLNFEWSLEELEFIMTQGVKIEVYLGKEDNIIDVESAKEFFLQVATVTYIKNANHFLQIK